MRKLFNVIMLLALVFGLVATVRPQTVLADTCDGDSGDNAIDCVAPGDPTDGDVVGDEGDDQITVGSDVTNSPDVLGDDNGLVGGDDSITTNNEMDGAIVMGDSLSDFAGYCGGCGSTVAGGADTITINGDAEYSGILGDGIEAEAGRCGGCAITATGGSDDITVNGDLYTSAVLGDGIIGSADRCGGCVVTATGGNDTITINGDASYAAVFGDGVVGTANSCGGCEAELIGGSDTITTNGDTAILVGDGIVNIDGECGGCGADVYGGDDTLVTNGDALFVAGDLNISVVGECEECGAFVVGGNDSITTNAYALAVVGDGIFSLVGDCVDCGTEVVGGNDTLDINGAAELVAGDGLITLVGECDGCGSSTFGGNDIINVNGDTLLVMGDGIMTNDYGVGGDDTITVNGSAYWVMGDGVLSTDSFLTFGPSAVDCGDICGGGVDGGNDTITINGVAGYVSGDYVDGCAGNDTININGDVLYDVYGDDAPFNCGVKSVIDCPDFGTVVCDAPVSGNDTVNIGAGSVTYSQVCGDIDVTTVDLRQGTVGGYIDGDYSYNNAGYDTLNFGLVTANQGEADSLAAYLAGFDPNGGTVEVNGQTYNYQNFEELNVNATIYTEGATRIYDDGVTLAFAVADGIQICNGPSGLKAGLIDYGRLTAGQRAFGANGFVVTLEDVGSQHFNVHVWKDGVEQFDDADGDGAADDLFVFGF